MKTGILLCGCGIGDGSAVEEVMLTYLALDRFRVEYIPLAINENQHDVADHLIETITAEKRNMLTESARIGRGKIADLGQVDCNKLNGLIIPGGMGIYKNLSTYLAEKDKFTVHPAVENVINKLYEQRKPLGGICASSILIARSLYNSCHAEMKVCTCNDAYKELLAGLRAKAINCPAGDVVVDEENKIVTTPAFMVSQNMNEIAAGIDKLVETMVNL